MGSSFRRRIRHRLLSRATSVAACLVLAAMSVQMAPPVALAKVPTNTTSPAGPSVTLLSKKAAPTEVPSLRTVYSDTYDNHDGTYTAQISAGPINYKPAGSRTFQPIDTTLAPIAGGNGRVRAAHLATPVEIGSADDPAGLLSFDTGHGKLALRLPPGVQPGQPGSKPSTKGNVADVAGVMPNVDLRAAVDNSGVSTFFTLTSAPASPSFTLALDTAGLKAELQDNGSILFLDKSGEVVATMPAPYATDSSLDNASGAGASTYNVHYSLSSEGSTTLLTVSVDPAWLATATYPVYVDPTFSGTAYVWDNSVSSTYSTTVFSDHQSGGSPNWHEMLLGTDPTYGGYYNDYIRFDVSSIANTTVDSATLSVYPWHQYTSPTATWLNRVDGSWNPSTLTFHNAPTANTNITYANLSAGSWGHFGVTSTVQSWVSNGATNYGFQLNEAYCSGECPGTYWKRIVDSKDPSGDGPQLAVTYSVPSAAPTSPINSIWTNSRTLQWQYYGNGGPAQTGYSIQIATDPSFGSTFWNDNGAGSGTVYTIPANVTLNDGTLYYWRVSVADGYSGSWSAAATFRWDVNPPTWNGFTGQNLQGQTDVSSGPFNFTWNAPSDSESGVSGGASGLNYAFQDASITAPNVCGSNWTTFASGWWSVTTTSWQAPLSSPVCYRLGIAPIDDLGNGGTNNYAYSGAVLFDSTRPAAPIVSVGPAAGSYFNAGSNAVYFQPANPGSFTMTSSGSDSVSGIGSNAFSFTAPSTGWSTTAPSGANPTSMGFTWSAAAASTSLSITTTSNAGLVSPATSVQLTADSTAPLVGFTTLPAGSTAYQITPTFNQSWVETDAGSGVATTSVARFVAQADPAQPGTCHGLTFSNDSAHFSATPTVVNGVASLADTNLADGYCYYWEVTVTDHVGNTGVYDSGWLMRDTSAPNVPSVTANGAGVYQSPSGVVYVNPQNAGTLTLTSTGSDAGTLSGIGSSTFGSLQAGDQTGWTPTPSLPATVASNPASINLAWTATPAPVNTSLQVNTNTRAGVPSPQLTVSLVSDNAPPVGVWNDYLTAGSLVRQNTTSYQLSWTEQPGSGPGIASRSLQRQKAPIVTAGACPSGADPAWANDGAATADTSGVTVSGLLDGHCYRWFVTLTDNLGLAGTYGSGSVLVDTTSPYAYLSIVDPKAGQPVSGVAAVTGSAIDTDLASWVLEYGSGAVPTSWTTLATSTTQVNNGPFGAWATGAMSGVYTVRLTVVDWGGNTTAVSSTVYVDNADRGVEPYYTSVPFDLAGGWNLGVNVATGEATLGRTLFDLPGIGPDQTLSLTYNSADTRPNDPLHSPFGSGWSSNLTQYLDLSNVSTPSGSFVVWHRADGAEVPFGLIDGSWTALAGHYETLTSLSGGRYKLTYTDGSSLTFDSSGRLSAITDRYAKPLGIAWSSGSAVATDAAGRAMNITLSGSLISRVVDSAGRAWTFTYSGANLASMVDASGNETDLASYTAGNCPTNSYAGACLVVSRQLTSLSPSGSPSATTTRWTVGYDAFGRVASVANPAQAAAGIAATFTYGSPFALGATVETTPGDPTSGTPALTTTYNLDVNARGWVDSQVQAWTQASVPVSWTTNYGYDVSGDVTSIARQIDTSGHYSTKSWTYNGAGEVTAETDPLTATSTYTTSYAYDSDKNLQTQTVAGTSTTPHLSIETAYTYDSVGHVSCKIENLTVDINTPGLTCDAVNGPQNIPPATADANLVTTYAYDANDDLTAQTDPTGVVTRYAYDSVGNRTSMTRNYQSGGTTDDTSIDSTNVTTTYVYDPTTTAGKAGLVTSEIDPITNRVIPSVNATTGFTYDAAGNLLTEILPSDAWVQSNETVIAYDEFGNQVSSSTCTPAGTTAAACVAAATSTSVTTRDPLGRATSVADSVPAVGTTPAKTTSTTSVYDLAGNLYTTTPPDGVTTTNAYDGLGRVVSASTAGATTTHAFDGLGDETTTTAPASNTTTATTTRTFYPSGRVATVTTDAAGTLTYVYDAIGRGTGSVDAAGLAVSSTAYDALGHVTSAMTTNTVSKIDGTGTTQVQTAIDTAYDPDGRVISVTLPYTSGQTKIYDTTAYDALGRAITKTTNYVAGSSDPAANLVTRTYFDEAGDAVATLDPKSIVARSIYSVTGILAETIANCTDSGTTPPVDTTGTPLAIGTCAGLGTHDGSTNVITRSQDVTGAGAIVTTRTVGTVTTTTTRDGDGRVLKTVVDPATGGYQIETDYAYDSHGRQIAQSTPAPSGTGRVVSVTVYDANGRVSEAIANCTDSPPDSTWSACVGNTGQDGVHNLITLYVYDAAGNLTSQISPTGATTAYTYDAAGRVFTVTANNATTRYYYDAGGRKIAVAAPNDALSSDGHTYSYTVTRYAYDAAGNMVAKLVNCTHGGAVPTTDAGIASCLPGTGDLFNSTTNVLMTYAYDSQGNLISTTAPSPADTGATTATVTTQYAYDTDNRLCRVLENATGPGPLTCTSSVSGTTTANVSTSYTYDAAGHIASQTQVADPFSGHTTAATSYVYNGTGHVVSQTDPDNKTTSWTYDANGNKASETDPDTAGGSTVAWLYDSAGRLCRRVAASAGRALASLATLAHPCTDAVSNAGIDTRYAYDSASNLGGATDAVSGQVVAAAYDTDNRPTAVSDTGGPIGSSDPGTTYAYTSATGNSLTRVGRTDPSGAYTFTLDTYGRQLAMTNPLSGGAGDAYAWTYGPAGDVVSASEPLGSAGTTHLVTASTFDPLGRVAAKTTTVQTGGTTTATPATYAYTYNAAGSELTGSSTLTGDTTNGTTSYTYDPLGRLTSAAIPTQPLGTYTWNATPDRSSTKAGTAGAVTTYYTAASRPLSDTAGGSYLSDGEGRLTASPGQTLTYDNLGRLVSSSTSAGKGKNTNATYTYDPLDRLESVVSSGYTTTYLYVGLTNTIAQTSVVSNKTSTTTTHLTDATGSDLADVTSAAAAYLGHNAHGDLTFTTNAAGTVTFSGAYDPFGRLVASSGTQPACGWQGSLIDSYSGLYYVIARWYSPTLGRFLSVDPRAGISTSPQSLDRYAYVRGDPLGGVDPVGTCTWDTITMSCVGTNANNTFNTTLAAATTQPFNKCLATNFYAAGCSSSPVAGKVQTLGTYVEATAESSASPDLIAASDIISAQVAAEKAVENSEVTRQQQAVTQAFAQANGLDGNTDNGLNCAYNPSACANEPTTAERYANSGPEWIAHKLSKAESDALMELDAGAGPGAYLFDKCILEGGSDGACLRQYESVYGSPNTQYPGCGFGPLCSTIDWARQNPGLATADVIAGVVTCLALCPAAVSAVDLYASGASLETAITAGAGAAGGIGMFFVGVVTGNPGDPAVTIPDTSASTADVAPESRSLTEELFQQGGVSEKWNDLQRMPGGLVKSAYLMTNAGAKWNVQGDLGRYIARQISDIETASGWEP